MLCYGGYLLFRDRTGGAFAGLIFFQPFQMVAIVVFGVMLGLGGSLRERGAAPAACVGDGAGVAAALSESP